MTKQEFIKKYNPTLIPMAEFEADVMSIESEPSVPDLNKWFAEELERRVPSQNKTHGTALSYAKGNGGMHSTEHIKVENDFKEGVKWILSELLKEAK